MVLVCAYECICGRPQRHARGRCAYPRTHFVPAQPSCRRCPRMSGSSSTMRISGSTRATSILQQCQAQSRAQRSGSPDIIEVAHHTYIWRKVPLYLLRVTNVWHHVATLMRHQAQHTTVRSVLFIVIHCYQHNSNHGAVTWVLQVGSGWVEDWSTRVELSLK